MNKTNRHGWVSLNDPVDSARNKLPTTQFQQPTALLEPMELNEIPLHNFNPDDDDKKFSNQPEDEKIPSEPIPTTPTTRNVQQQNQKTQKKEIILEVSNTQAGTSANNECNDDSAEFKNGKLLTMVFPSNKHCAWLTPPQYDCQMPPILANKQNLLPSNVFMDIIRTVNTDLRFFSYAVLYSRVTPIWIIFAIIVLLVILASSPQGGFAVMIFALVWIGMLIVGVLFCALFRKYIVLSLRSLLKEINKTTFLQHRILLGVQDKGQLSCHKVALMFIFYDPSGCREDIQRLLRIQANALNGQRQHSEIEILHETEELLCAYAQGYAKAYMKKRFLFPTRPSEGVSDFRPKHCQKSLCLCQYVEQV